MYKPDQYCYQLIMSKKQRKRLKIQQKDKDFKPPPRKLHYQEFQIPPYTDDHAKALMLEYLSYDKFQIPIHHLNIFNQIRGLYQNFQNADIYMKDLDLPEVLDELRKSGCINTEKRALGTTLVTIILSVFKRRTYEEYERCVHMRPVTPPPDPITFQQQKREATPKEKEERLKIENLLNAPSLFGEKIDIEAQLQNVVSYEQKIEALEFKEKKNLEYCDHCTRDKCQKARGHSLCKKKHFRAIINQNTDQSFGNCPHLNACHNPDCKLIHYIEQDQQSQVAQEKMLAKMRMESAEWINCDLRYFDFKILGKFNVVMADPPWDIHMSLPYGTLKDKELLNLRVDILQDEGLIFLWVTGRAMELGRECLIKWGYRRVDELVWIKTNQINRLIITGKTGHWLNHTKEHCLVGIKGNPKINIKLDCDVILSKVRETSRKPDQIYGMIERMSPGGKKIELFGRPDNCMPGWLTLGNQLTDVRLKDPQIIERYRKSYPMSDLNQGRMERNLEEMSTPDNLHKIYNNHIQKNTG